ncbi:MAG: transketolase [Patescibacteria group bacterium]
MKTKARWVRRQVLEMAVRAGGGHVAPSLSCVDILVALYYDILQAQDRFILSKGHAAAALYAILADRGFFPLAELEGFCRGGRLGGHPDWGVFGVDFPTGALGHGLSVGAGMAWAARMDRSPSRVFVLLGDGECQKGQVWEAAAFAGHHRLSNLTAIIDRNRLQAVDATESTMRLDPLLDRWRYFGWLTLEVDGHDFISLMAALRAHAHRKPLAVICRTTKGKGISFMENRAIWHFRVPTGEELEQARRELT